MKRMIVCFYALMVAITLLPAVVHATGAPAPEAAAQAEAAAPKAAPSAEKLELAKEYMKLMPLKPELDKIIEKLSQGVQQQQRVLFRSIVARTMQADRLEVAAQLAAAEVFTEAELKSMVDYYSSEEGRSASTKMPEFQARMQPVISQMVQDTVTQLRENNVVMTQ